MSCSGYGLFSPVLGVGARKVAVPKSHLLWCRVPVSIENLQRRKPHLGCWCGCRFRVPVSGTQTGTCVKLRVAGAGARFGQFPKDDADAMPGAGLLEKKAKLAKPAPSATV